jgi:hypothetical protein
MCDFVELSRE